jgi:lipoprotein-anchoring transpeptidase ErfK/SrfK
MAIGFSYKRKDEPFVGESTPHGYRPGVEHSAGETPDVPYSVGVTAKQEPVGYDTAPIAGQLELGMGTPKASISDSIDPLPYDFAPTPKELEWQRPSPPPLAAIGDNPPRPFQPPPDKEPPMNREASIPEAPVVQSGLGAIDAWGKTVAAASELAKLAPSVQLPEVDRAIRGAGNNNAAPKKQVRATERTVGQAMDLSPLKQPPAPTGNRVVVSIPDKKVVVYNPSGEVVREYSVYVGTAKNPTPRGQFRIMENIVPNDREWYYGGHWLGFAKGYKPEPGGTPYAGFHGWVYDKDDDAIEREQPGWKTTTHGCVQMNNRDVAEFSRMVGPGDSVSIIDTPIAPSPPRRMQVPGLGNVSMFGRTAAANRQ